MPTNIFQENLKCNYCTTPHSLSVQDASKIICTSCGQTYPVINGIPVVINEQKSIFTFQDFENQRSLFFDISGKGKTVQKLGKLLPHLDYTPNTRKNYQLLTEELLKQTPRPRILVLGGSIAGEGMGDFLSDSRLELVESDVSFGPRTQIILDAHDIPFEDESFDAVVAQAVLEHVINPQMCVKEIERVLKPNGLIYIETPFMQQVHGGAYDFTRFTHSGHRSLLRNFDEIKSGSVSGAGAAMAWAYQYLMLSLFGFNDKMALITKLFVRLTGFWFKYLDLLATNRRRALDASCGLFFIGRKAKNGLSDKDIIAYFHQQK
jgi:SAM-dependent methyltransferase/uncharacterized protein YbaR (Trm112 family)